MSAFSLPRIAALALVAVLANICVTGAAFAQNAQFNSAEAQKYIEDCWAISKEDRDSGAIGRMRHGTVRTATCMEKVILDLTERIFDRDTYTREKMQKRLDAIRENYERLIWDIYNENKGCPPCGIMYQLEHAFRYAQLLEGITKHMVLAKNENNL